MAGDFETYRDRSYVHDHLVQAVEFAEFYGDLAARARSSYPNTI